MTWLVVAALPVFGVLLVAACGSTYGRSAADQRGKLTDAEAWKLLDEARSFTEASGLEFEGDAGCWFDRLPSEALTVVCGPLENSAAPLADISGPPPYYRQFALKGEVGADGVSRLVLAKPESVGVGSFAEYPVKFFRPGGEERVP